MCMNQCMYPLAVMVAGYLSAGPLSSTPPPTLQPAASPSQVDPVLRKVATVLEPIHQCAPMLIGMLYVLARVNYLSG